MEVGGQRQAPEALSSTLFTEGWAWKGAENHTPTRIRSPDRPVRSESLYRLSYPGSLNHLLQESFGTHHMSSITHRTLSNDIKIRPHITELTAKRL